MLPIAATAPLNVAAATEAAWSMRQLVEGITEIDTTARSLRDHAEQLKTMVARFKIDDEHAGDSRGWPASDRASQPALTGARVARP
jgi:hypothetical protein